MGERGGHPQQNRDAGTPRTKNDELASQAPTKFWGDTATWYSILRKGVMSHGYRSDPTKSGPRRRAPLVRLVAVLLQEAPTLAGLRPLEDLHLPSGMAKVPPIGRALFPPPNLRPPNIRPPNRQHLRVSQPHSTLGVAMWPGSRDEEACCKDLILTERLLMKTKDRMGGGRGGAAGAAASAESSGAFGGAMGAMEGARRLGLVVAAERKHVLYSGMDNLHES